MSKILVCNNCGWVNKFFEKDDPNNIFSICMDDSIQDLIENETLEKSVARAFFKQILDEIDLTKWWSVEDYNNTPEENRICPVCRSSDLEIKNTNDYISRN